MTNAEINLAIAKIEFAGKELYQCADHVDVRLGAGDYTCVDYVNDWADIGPIIEREKISISPWRNHWKAVCPNENHHIFSETPTKAAALCYLKMKGVE
jgi:hypothetical protein